MTKQHSPVRWAMVLMTLVVSVSPALPPAQARTQEDLGDPSTRPPSTEQTIYIPYKKLRDVFEREGRGVFLPYEEFQALWRAARDHTEPPDVSRPPVDAMITATRNRATVSHDVVSVDATILIDVLTGGWKEIPLRLDDAAITSATLGGEPARLIHTRDRGYALLYENPEQSPTTLELELQYAKSYARAPGRNSVSFNAPQAPISRWRVAIPEEGVKVNLRPLIAATDVPADAETPPDEDGNWSVVLAFVGAAPSVGIDWTPRSEGATGLAALADVASEQRIWIDEGVVRTRSDLTYDITRAELSRLLIDVPADERVVDVSDANVRQWTVEVAAGDGAALQRITVELFEPVKGRQHVRVELERFIEKSSPLEIQVPLVRAIQAARNEGIVVVKTGADLSPHVQRSIGLIQIDAGELPAALSSDLWDFAYRFSDVPFDLALDVSKISPLITADTLVTAFLSPEELRLDCLTVYDIRRAGVFELQVELPAGFDVRHVGGRSANGAIAVDVDTHRVDRGDENRLTISLSRKAMGRVALGLSLVRLLDNPELITPGSESAELDVLVPRVIGEHVRRENGRLVVFAPESLRVNPRRSAGLRSVPPAEAFQGMALEPESTPSRGRPTLAYIYAEDPVSLTLAAQRRRPYVSVSQLLAVMVEPGLVKYDASLLLHVKYSGVKSLRVDVPDEISADLRNTTTGVRDEVIDPQPGDVAAGHVAWRLTGEREFLGEAMINLAWERELEDLGVGKSVNLVVPRINPHGVDRAWGQVVIMKSETVDVHEAGEPRGVRPIDPQHDLMPSAQLPNAARAFEFQDEWSLAITATHYELEDVKRTSIERALLRMVLTRSDHVTVQALYRMRSARQRLAVILPDGVEFDTQPLRINGSAVALERGKPGEFFVPLPGTGPQDAFVLELRYVRNDPDVPFEAPVFPDEPAIQMAYGSVYLPESRMLLGSPGAWTQEMYWRETGWLDRQPEPRLSESELISWVSEGIAMTGDLAGGLQADGRRHLFSTLRPAGDSSATLSLVTMNRTGLSALLFIVVAGLGIWLLRAGAARRFVAVGVLATLLVMAGVFMPTFALQVMDRVLLAALLVVAVLWTVQYFTVHRPNDPLVRARKDAKIEAARARAAASAAVVAASPILGVPQPGILTPDPSPPLAGSPPPGEARSGPGEAPDAADGGRDDA